MQTLQTMKLTNIRRVGRFTNPDTGRPVNIHKGDRVNGIGSWHFYILRGERMLITESDFFARWKKENALPPLSPEEKQMAELRRAHPEFFADEVSAGIAAVIIEEMGDYLTKHGPVERVGMLACIMSLMFRMATAGIKSSSLRDGRKCMQRIFVEDHLAAKRKEKRS